LRTAKYTLLIISLVLILVGCGKKERIPSAAESMSRNKLVRILTDARNAPFEFGAGTGVQGLDVDIGNEIGKTIGMPVKWVKAEGYNHLFELLGNGEVEILISAIAIDPSRTEEFAFSHPYHDSGDAIAHQRTNFTIKDLASLAGKKVGVGSGRPGDKFMSTQKTAANVTISRFPTLDDALGALNRTEIDAVVGDQPLITYSSFKSFPNTLVLPVLLDHYQYAVVVRKGETALLDEVNETIDLLKRSGQLQAMITKWFGNVQKEAALDREKTQREEELRKTPKAISVNITKLSGPFSMDRLDGFVLVLEGTQGKYESTPILTTGNKGNCKFTRPVPPGDYKLNLSILRMRDVKVAVPDLPKSTLTMDMNISTSGITIPFK
jgi:ABC-type amino acid transport substrate-binding protein